jgi:peptide/nickel transport system substrate-binding protein
MEVKRCLDIKKVCLTAPSKLKYTEDVMKNILTYLLALFLIGLIALTGCTTSESTEAPEATEAPEVVEEPQPTPEPEGPTAIIIAIGGDPSSMDPQAVDDGHERTVNENIYETLIARDPNTMELVPSLATSWQQLDDTTWEFKLREGVKFHNGEPFDAEAVAFSIERVIEPEYNSEQLAYYTSITGAEAIDPMTVHIITEGPDPTVPARMYWMKMVPPEHASDPEFWANPVGTGPYKFVEWKRGEVIKLEANEEYWGGSPSIKEVTWRIIPEEVTRLAALVNNEVDLVRGLPPDYISEVPKALSTPGLEILWLRPNTIIDPLTSKELRMAMNYAINREAIAESLYSGYAKPVQGQLLTPAHFGFNPQVEGYPYDPEKAKELIIQSGYDGEEIDLPVQAGRWSKDKEVAEVVAQDLTAVGLNVNLRFVEWSDWLDLMFAPKEQKGHTISGNANELFDADRTVTAILHSEGGQSTIVNPELDKLIDDARTETDIDKREQMYHEVIQIAHDEAYWAPLIILDNIYGMSEGLQWTPRQDDKVIVFEMSWE